MTAAASSAGWRRTTATCPGNRTTAATATPTPPGQPRSPASATTRPPAMPSARATWSPSPPTAPSSTAACRTSTRSTASTPAYDFTISLVSSNYGLPAPEVISLSSVISTNLSPTGHYDIFDPTRATGGEHWQGMRVRINGLTLVTTNGWNTNSDWSSRYCTATDGEGRQFPSSIRSMTLAPPQPTASTPLASSSRNPAPAPTAPSATNSSSRKSRPLPPPP